MQSQDSFSRNASSPIQVRCGRPDGDGSKSRSPERMTRATSGVDEYEHGQSVLGYGQPSENAPRLGLLV